MSRSFSRRKLLKGSAAAASMGFVVNPLDLLIENLFQGALNQALAAEVGMKPRNYVYFSQFGAPARWGYDLFLTPYGRQNFNSGNASLVNRYVASNGRYLNAEYGTVSRGGIEVPPVWAANIPRPDGSWVPMARLLDNLMHIRGINTANFDHAGSQVNNLTPLGAPVSTAALSAQASEKPIPAVNCGTIAFAFSNAKGLSPVSLVSGQPLEELLAPFRGQTPTSMKANLAALKTGMDKARAALELRAKTLNTNVEAQIVAAKGATKLLEQTYTGLAEAYATLEAKYSALIRRSFNILGTDTNAVMPGITDLPIGVTGTRTSNEYRNSADSSILQATDLRTTFGPNSFLNGVARAFAVAEYTIVNNLSSSVSGFCGFPLNLTDNGRTFVLDFDEHFHGRMVSPLSGAMTGRAMAACIYEFISAIGPDTFKETVIHVGSEFNRSPRADGFGSDHAAQAQSMALYSGAINGPYVIGDIKAGVANGNYPGTWGEGAQGLGLGAIAATLASVIRVPSPITTESSPVVDDGTEIRPLLQPGRIVG